MPYEKCGICGRKYLDLTNHARNHHLRELRAFPLTDVTAVIGFINRIKAPYNPEEHRDIRDLESPPNEKFL